MKAATLQHGAFVQVSWRRGAVVSRPQGTLGGSAPLTTQDLATGKPETAGGPAFIRAPQQAAGALRQDAAARSGASKPTLAAGTSASKSKGPGAHSGLNIARQKAEGTSAPAPGLTAIANLALTSPRAIQPAALGVPGVPGVPVTATTELASSAPRAAAPQPSPAEQVALRIHKSAAAGQDRISIKLHPAELGRVDVRLELGEDGLVRAALVAERAETLDLLQRDARSLERALQQAGLQLDSGSLSFNLRSGEQQGEDADETDSAAARAADAEAEDGSDVVQAAAPGARHDGVLNMMV